MLVSLTGKRKIRVIPNQKTTESIRFLRKQTVSKQDVVRNSLSELHRNELSCNAVPKKTAANSKGCSGTAMVH
jgi:hypothetical protein